MSAPCAWPALRGARAGPRLVCEHGVWGKVHGQASDFRWIARTPGIEAGIERRLPLGSEDAPRDAVCWRALGPHSVALHLYPSRAMDAAGRTGFLEKQILVWNRPAGVPAALGALVLLPAVAKLGPETWWEQARVRPWSDPSFAIALPAADGWPVDPAVVARALDEVRLNFTRTMLARLYAGLVAPARPVIVERPETALSPAALAALLLPLPREQADRLSLAGALPSTRFSLEELARHWDVLVVPSRVGLHPTQVEPGADALRMADALLAGDPAPLADLEELAGLEEPVVLEDLRLDETPPWASRAQLALSAEEGRDLLERAFVTPPVSHVPRRLRPGRMLQLTRGAASGSALLDAIADFARSEDRRWLHPRELRALAASALPIDLAARQALHTWARDVAAQLPAAADAEWDLPHGAADEQWGVKAELLRALVYVLAPEPDTLRRLPVPQPGRVPALLYAPALDRERATALVSHGEEGLRSLIRQSFGVRWPNFARTLRAWLAAWRPPSKMFARLLEEELRHPALPRGVSLP